MIVSTDLNKILLKRPDKDDYIRIYETFLGKVLNEIS